MKRSLTIDDLVDSSNLSFIYHIYFVILGIKIAYFVYKFVHKLFLWEDDSDNFTLHTFRHHYLHELGILLFVDFNYFFPTWFDFSLISILYIFFSI